MSVGLYVEYGEKMVYCNLYIAACLFFHLRVPLFKSNCTFISLFFKHKNTVDVFILNFARGI